MRSPTRRQQTSFQSLNKRGPKGAPLTTHEPMPARSLTYRLKDASFNAGLPQRLTLYCTRRSRLTEVAHKKGYEHAATMAGHQDANTAVVRAHYDAGMVVYDVSAATLAKREREREELVENICHYRVPVLDNSTKTDFLIKEHPDVIDAIKSGMREHEVRLMKRRLREQFKIVLRLEESSNLRKSLTQMDMQNARSDF